MSKNTIKPNLMQKKKDTKQWFLFFSPSHIFYTFSTSVWVQKPQILPQRFGKNTSLTLKILKFLILLSYSSSLFLFTVETSSQPATKAHVIFFGHHNLLCCLLKIALSTRLHLQARTHQTNTHNASWVWLCYVMFSILLTLTVSLLCKATMQTSPNI